MQNLEIEIKLGIPNNEVAETIAADKKFLNLATDNTIECMEVLATYYDTPVLGLQKAGIVFRVRKEGDKIVATVKKGGNSDSCLSQRGEWNIEVPSLMPDLEPFFTTTLGSEIKEAVGDRNLVPLFSCRFARRYVILNLEKDTQAELAVDVGSIVAGKLTEPICELELELKQGDLSVMLKVASEIAELYNLVPELRSKFARGLVLSGK